MAYDSAMPEGTKRLNAVNELLRRLLNTTPGLPNTKDELTRVTNEYMITMKISGYPERYRQDTILDAYRGYKNKLSKAENGDSPLFRNKEDGAQERYNNKIKVKSTWFRGKKNQNQNQNANPPPTTKHKKPKPKKNPIPAKIDTNDSRKIKGVVFIPYTKGSTLRKAIQTADDKTSKLLGLDRTKYVERAGIKIASLLVRKNIWLELQGGCQRPKCYVCKSQHGKGISCRLENICYQITCSICEKQEKKVIYIGETSRSAYERILEHMFLFRWRKEGDVEQGQANSVLWQHSKATHQGQMTTDDWSIKITSQHFTSLNRKMTEAVRISREPEASLLNNKQEFGAINSNIWGRKDRQRGYQEEKKPQSRGTTK